MNQASNLFATIETMLNEGAALMEREPAQAADRARQILDLDEGIAEAHRLSAAALRHLGRTAEAEQAELDAIAACARRPLLVAAATDLTAKNFERAEAGVRKYLKADPDDAGAWRMLGEIASHFSLWHDARKALERALALAPAFVTARIHLAKTVHRLGEAGEAIEHLDHALNREPGNAVALSYKAAIMVQLRRLDEAVVLFETLLEHHPSQARGWMNYAFLLKTLGRQDDSITAYRHSVSLDPERGVAWWGLANLKTVKFSQDDVAVMQHALTGDISIDDRLHLHFALGKAFADQAAYQKSFKHYAEGNRLRRAQTPYDGSIVEHDVSAKRKLQTPNFFKARAGLGYPAKDPIFIVGMPRSGSTLVEQILASHPRIEGTEELFDIQKIAASLADRDNKPEGYLDKLAHLSSSELYELGKDYIESTRKYRNTDRPLFTDKMPGNWSFVGFIHLILPNAKIIDIRRHPLACGFANYSQHFHWGINFAYDLEDIGSYYAQYIRDMAGVDQALPGLVHRVFYEDLIDDLEREVRRLLRYLELPFDPACLRFYENARAVHTPSSEQVRQPVYRDGVAVWQRYEEWLDPLKLALGQVLSSYPDTPTYSEHGK